jgi:TPP-dependent pyruvate/acetoin dehydrogenase alpha subunit
MYGLRKIGGFLHLYNGQEAVAVGSVAAIDLAKDYMLTSYGPRARPGGRNGSQSDHG